MPEDGRLVDRNIAIKTFDYIVSFYFDIQKNFFNGRFKNVENRNFVTLSIKPKLNKKALAVKLSRPSEQ